MLFSPTYEGQMTRVKMVEQEKNVQKGKLKGKWITIRVNPPRLLDM